MASFVIGPFMTCAHPLSQRQIELLYLTAAWTLTMLDSGAMSTDTMFFLIGKQYDGAF